MSQLWFPKKLSTYSLSWLEISVQKNPQDSAKAWGQLWKLENIAKTC